MALLVEADLGKPPEVGAGVRVRRLDEGRLDPIAKGRLVSALEASERVVVVGLEAAAWAAKELEDVPVHFEGGVSRVPGAELAARGWTGTLAWEPEQVLGFARAAGWKRLAVAYTPGYESALPALRAAARASSVTLGESAVAARPDIPAAVAELAGRSDALWVLGDPLLTGGAGIDFIIEQSLSRRLPLVAPDAGLVERGAYLGVAPDWPGLLAHAAALAAAAAARGPAAWPTARVAFSGRAGKVVVNEVLRRRWGAAGGVR